MTFNFIEFMEMQVIRSFIMARFIGRDRILDFKYSVPLFSQLLIVS